MLDIGGDVGALIVTMPATMEGQEVEIRPKTIRRRATGQGQEGHDHTSGPGHGHDHHHGGHLPHVAVVNRPIQGTFIASLVFPELVEGGYELYPKGTHDVRMAVHIKGGEVTTAAWPT
jgi:hypothetical protein